MSNTDFGREPIELVEFVLPKCANTYGSAPCMASGTEKCFNTRATCVDPDNYRDIPDRHLAPDQTFILNETIDSGDVDRNDNFFASFDVRFTAGVEGIIWEQGSETTGAYLGVVSDTLVFQVKSTGNANIEVDATQFAGKQVILYVEIAFVASTSMTTNLWVFDKVELTLTLLGTDSATPGSVWTDTDDGAIGFSSGEVGANRLDASWTGGSITAYFHNNEPAPAMTDNFRSNLWIGRGVFGEPSDEQYILPCLVDLGTIGTKINLFGSDDDYEPLGRRATLDFTCRDFAHSDYTQDPYLSDRNYKPLERSTFWLKWIARQKFAKVGGLVRVHDGYAGQPIADYQTRSYMLDKIERNEDGVSVHCRDFLSRTEFRKTQIPEVSTGILTIDLNDEDTSLFVAGDVTAEYPTSGTIRVNNEIMLYTGIEYIMADARTSFTGLTRASDGSEASSHNREDLVQLCRRVTNSTITDLLTEWLVTDANIPAQLIDLEEIASEVNTYLFPYRLNTLLTEPTALDELLGRMSQECSFYIWWGERTQKIRFKTIRATSTTDIVTEFSYENNIVTDSFSVMEKPKQRLNVVTFYYTPRDYSADLEKATNFRNALKQVDGTVSSVEQYGNIIQTRELYSLFITSGALAAQTVGRIGLRYQEVPLYADFYVDAKDRAIWTGDIITINHPMIVDAYGERVIGRWIIIESEEVDPGHLIRYQAVSITIDGELFFITEDGIGDYTAALFAAGNFFITDNDGLNPDGSEGAKIQ